ncbi:2-hydroxy-palmitic acid dioxygenase Mpo1-like [Dillenia turbinata]|uniref:2-hydroxy-palmitic acid dioxygenase Mpo1-like n=1 Tax=Dillenia turbinata TaxID=194707 RepID=A0AAN8Z510_9MAGN
MAKSGIFDLEKHFAFYGAYHNNPINIFIHMVFVWPIFFTTLVLLYFTPSLFNCAKSVTCPCGNTCVLGLNLGFFFALIYAVFYVLMDRKAGSLAAVACLFCWVGSSFLASKLGFSLAWKELFAPPVRAVIPLSASSFFVLASQVVCWTGQFIGHGVFEKRVPALLDNFIQAFLMAPFFALQKVVGYEPYPGFITSVAARVEEEKKARRDKNEKKSTERKCKRRKFGFGFGKQRSYGEGH